MLRFLFLLWVGGALGLALATDHPLEDEIVLLAGAVVHLDFGQIKIVKFEKCHRHIAVICDGTRVQKHPSLTLDLDLRNQMEMRRDGHDQGSVRALRIYFKPIYGQVDGFDDFCQRDGRKVHDSGHFAAIGAKPAQSRPGRASRVVYDERVGKK